MKKSQLRDNNLGHSKHNLQPRLIQDFNKEGAQPIGLPPYPILSTRPTIMSVYFKHTHVHTERPCLKRLSHASTLQSPVPTYIHHLQAKNIFGQSCSCSTRWFHDMVATAGLGLYGKLWVHPSTQFLPHLQEVAWHCYQIYDKAGQKNKHLIELKPSDFRRPNISNTGTKVFCMAQSNQRWMTVEKMTSEPVISSPKEKEQFRD